MGGCGAKEITEEVKRDEAIEKEQKALENKEKRIHQVLLLGPGESGKSTVFKQMIINYGQGFKSEDRSVVKASMIRNIFMFIGILLKEQKTVADPEAVFSDEAKSASERLLAVSDNVDFLTPELLADLKTLWTDKGFRQLYTHHGRFHIPESTAYFMDKLDKLADPDYVATDEDLIAVRIRTTGMVQETFVLDKHTFRIIDVGGQRSERKKWVANFEGVNAIIFVAAISEYDMVVWEDEKTNRMHEALNVFEDIANKPVFERTPIIVFLNKSDLFEKKFPSVSLSKAFPDWDSSKDGDLEAGYLFIQHKFVERNHVTTKEIFMHRTTAINAENIKAVWSIVSYNLVKTSLEDMGFLE